MLTSSDFSLIFIWDIFHLDSSKMIGYSPEVLNFKPSNGYFSNSIGSYVTNRWLFLRSGLDLCCLHLHCTIRVASTFKIPINPVPTLHLRLFSVVKWKRLLWRKGGGNVFINSHPHFMWHWMKNACQWLHDKNIPVGRKFLVNPGLHAFKNPATKSGNLMWIFFANWM